MALSRRRTEMASEKHRPEEALSKLRRVDVLVSQGRSVAEAIRAVGVTEVTHYRRRREFGGLKSDQARRLREAVADLTPDEQILAGAARGNSFSIRGAWRNSSFAAAPLFGAHGATPH